MSCNFSMASFQFDSILQPTSHILTSPLVDASFGTSVPVIANSALWKSCPISWYISERILTLRIENFKRTFHAQLSVRKLIFKYTPIIHEFLERVKFIDGMIS